ncbi:folate family ECF transporter S component [Jeotgalibaca dankookensis]|uniref:folate family ECF transporter S component n=1 Tax=Jeotgalibaca dankookensis TaxID=708126 RepID=UPI0007812C45|nr:folate family ECF transporter S component [Jeotgalibaca dankookensis]
MFKKFSNQFSARDIAVIGLMIAMKVVLTRFLAIETQFVRVGFTFIPTILLAIMYGPGIGFSTGATADLLGFFLFPKGFPYYPGFTLSAAIAPVIYALILYKKPLTVTRLFVASLLVTVFVNVGLNSLWLYILYDQAFRAILPVRLAQNALSLPITVAIMYGITGNSSIKRVLSDYPIKWRA